MVAMAAFLWILPAEGQIQKATGAPFVARTNTNPEEVKSETIEPVRIQSSSQAEHEKIRSSRFDATENDDQNAPADLERGSQKAETQIVPRPTRDDTSVDSDWQFEVTPYFYATGIRGPVEARGRRLDLDASFGKLFDSLDFTIAGSFEARKHRFVSLNDVIWYKLSNIRDTPGGLYGTAKIGINLVIIDPEAGYRVIKTKAASLDILGGARIWSLEANLNTTSGRLEGFEVSQRKTWAAPVIGTRGRIDITSKWLLEGKFDIGGGWGADLTTQVYAGGGYRFTHHIAAIAGYRYLQVKYDDNEGFLFDTKMNGIVIGVRFSF